MFASFAFSAGNLITAFSIRHSWLRSRSAGSWKGRPIDRNGPSAEHGKVLRPLSLLVLCKEKERPGDIIWWHPETTEYEINFHAAEAGTETPDR
jgi:hypothetical protein